MREYRYISEDEVRAMLREAVKKAGGQSALARKWKVSQTYIGQAMRGLQRPGDKLCRKMNIERFESSVTYLYSEER
jgi:DNA-binding transcriptional regulator YdaS (Cro superfamily)